MENEKTESKKNPRALAGGRGGNKRNGGDNSTSNISIAEPGGRRQYPIYREDGMKVVGYVQGGIFKKTIKGEKHMLQKPKAIAFDVVSLEQAEAAGASWVWVCDKKTHITYKSPIQQIWKKGFRFNRGFGNQIALTLSGWIKNGKVIEPDQLRLF